MLNDYEIKKQNIGLETRHRTQQVRRERPRSKAIPAISHIDEFQYICIGW